MAGVQAKVEDTETIFVFFLVFISIPVNFLKW